MTNKCSIDNCKNTALAKGLCNAHYIRKRSNKNMDAPVRNFNASKTCIECGKPTNGKGGYMRCQNHYGLYKRKQIKLKLIEKLGGKCVMCNQVFHHAAFDFHHTRDKVDHVSSMFLNRSEKEIFAEAEKCILLCANCHRIHHARDV